ncbi:ADP-ribosylglycohydrolase family protein [Saccharopolyspora sp. HNM0986]|nr:ADP-ribosylglycohydrolase family protein [Saccharopolyspora sp. HNM0986]
MLWSAWADALGFISELTDDAGLRRRLGHMPLNKPVAWQRRIGGRAGVKVALPAGCYSDDTQLRLATARAISHRGFDVESFANVELAVWPAYALGGGRASKAAARNLAKPGMAWFGNFFDGWTAAGGNGAAMRIQPHVWAASEPASLGPHLTDVLTNAVTTHGHPRALVGAVVHALALGSILEAGEVPSPESWPRILDLAEQAIKLFDDHPQLATIWRATWEKETESSFSSTWRETVDECRALLPTVSTIADELSNSPAANADLRQAAYNRLIESLGLSDPDFRGSGTTTVLASLALAAGFPKNPQDCAVLAARAVGTDTDTIATMAAALVGAANGAPADPDPILDRSYLSEQAHRLASISRHEEVERFSYPDLLHWQPPRKQLDAVGAIGDDLALAGLGYLTPVRQNQALYSSETAWQWMKCDFGASFLLKRRAFPGRLPEGAWPVRPSWESRRYDNAVHNLLQTDIDVGSQHIQAMEPNLFNLDTIHEQKTGDQHHLGSVEVDAMLSWVARENYRSDAIGYAVRRISEIGTLEQLIAFTAALRERLPKTF